MWHPGLQKRRPMWKSRKIPSKRLISLLLSTRFITLPRNECWSHVSAAWQLMKNCVPMPLRDLTVTKLIQPPFVPQNRLPYTINQLQLLETHARRCKKAEIHKRVPLERRQVMDINNLGREEVEGWLGEGEGGRGAYTSDNNNGGIIPRRGQLGVPPCCLINGPSLSSSIKPWLNPKLPSPSSTCRQTLQSTLLDEEIIISRQPSIIWP